MFYNKSGYNLFKSLTWQIKHVYWTYLVIFPRVLIAIINSNSSAANADIEADFEVSWLEWHARAVLLDHQLSLEEGALRGSGIDHLWLSDHN